MIKRLFPVIFLVMAASVAGALLFFQRLPGPASHPPASAGWLPVETKIYLQVWNVTRTLERLRKTDLVALYSLPSVQKFFAPIMRNAKRLRRLQEACAKIESAKIREAFIALTTVEMPVPGFVAGFQAESGPEVIRDLIEHPRRELLAWFPTAKVDAEKFDRYTFDTVTFGSSRIFIAVVKNWFFAASDPGLLVTVLDRQRRASVHGSLLVSRPFKSAIGPLPQDRETLAYFHSAALLTDLFAFLDVQGMTLDARTRSELEQWDAVAATTSIEDGAFRDAIFCSAKTPRHAPGKLKRDTVRAATEDTLLFLAMRLAPPATADVGPALAIDPDQLGPLRPFHEALIAAGISLQDIGASFGSEFGIGLNWKSSTSQPAPFALIETGDRRKLYRLLSLLQANIPGSQFIAEAETPDDKNKEPLPMQFVFPLFSGASLPLPVLQLQPRLRESGRYLVFGLDDRDVEMIGARLSPQNGEAARGEQSEKPFRPLSDVNEYRDAESSAGAADDFFLYADIGRLLTQTSAAVRPLLGLLGAISPEFEAGLRDAPLPPNEIYDQYLKPTTVAQSSRRDGVLFQSAGSVTLPQLVGGGVAAGIAFYMPKIEEMIKTGEFPFGSAMPTEIDAFQVPSVE